jgi:hypothetical protein
LLRHLIPLTLSMPRLRAGPDAEKMASADEMRRFNRADLI